MQAGEVLTGITGGGVTLSTGYGSATSSGSFSIRTNNAGTAGLSGFISLSTGVTTAGGSGHAMLRTFLARCGEPVGEGAVR